MTSSRFAPLILSCFATTHLAAGTWTVMVYICNENDLSGFAPSSIRQMMQVPSSEYLKVAVQHTVFPHNKNRRHLERGTIQSNNTTQWIAIDQSIENGTTESLIDFCSWAIETHPADHYALILWDHGTAGFDPQLKRSTIASVLFHTFVAHTTPPLLAPLFTRTRSTRGVAFNENTQRYLSSTELDTTLAQITKLIGRKLDVIGFDACFMAALDIASLVRKHAALMVASEESELGKGWNYHEILTCLCTGNCSPKEWVGHIITSYKNTYERTYPEHTLSAIELDAIELLEQAVDAWSSALILALNTNFKTMRTIVRKSRAPHSCTHFDEPAYIDLYHFASNLAGHLPNNSQHKELKQLAHYTQEVLQQIQRCIITSCTGRRHPRARGLSIYFPQYRLSKIYNEPAFPALSRWISFTKEYLS